MQVEWLTKQQAAERLHLGVRRTLELANRGVLKTEMHRDPLTSQMARRFSAGDIERYLEARRTPAEEGVRPSAEAARELAKIPTKSVAENDTGTELEFWRGVARDLLGGAAIPAAPAPWMTLARAAAYLGDFTPELLLSLIEQGQVPALRARGTAEKHAAVDCYRVKRTDLDAIGGVRCEPKATAASAIA